MPLLSSLCNSSARAAVVLRRPYVAVLRSPSIRACSSKSKIPDILDHATGLERRELLALRAGVEDPFDMKAYKRGPGTKDQPNLVPSMLDKRMIGCICEEDSTSIIYMWLHKGEPRRCECGHWFKLVDGKLKY